jgi:hypothetical protein
MTDDLVKMARERANAGGYYSAQWDMLADRIEKLEAALRSYVCNCTTEICDDCLTSTECGYRANKALEGKDD